MLELSFSVIGTAFIGGILMSLAPCTLPLIPAFIASLTPKKLGSGLEVSKPQVWDLFVRSVLFCIGFSFVFIIFGMLAGFFGSTVSVYKQILSQIGAVFIILFGLSLLLVFTLPFSVSFRIFDRILLKTNAPYATAIIGAIFALGWSPCAGPLLVSMLLLASESGTVFQGGLMLMVFSLGLSIPFILLGVLYGHTISFFKLYSRYYRAISVLSGTFLILIGIFILFGQSFRMTEFGFLIYSFFGYTPMCTNM